MNRLNFELYDSEVETKLIAREYRSLLKLFKVSLTKYEKDNLRRGLQMAINAHSNTRRKSGELYIFHPIAVARICVEEINLGVTSAICAFLHDTVEDTEITVEDIERNFNKEISNIVHGLTKINGIIDTGSSQQIENYKKLIMTLADDVRVILLKIADRLHNMRTMDSMAKDKQEKIASETLFLYAPLANRVGLGAIKSELEDLSLKYLEPKSYRNIVLKLKETKRQRTKQINEFIKPVEIALKAKNYNFEIYGRPKSIYSIWNKIHNKHVPFEEVFDLLAIRIIIDVPFEDEKQACWSVYSILTDKYLPIVDRLRDWISKPKSNGYEALHTTLMGPNGKFIEVQIRTKRMNEIAEKGIAAHHYYKGEKKIYDTNPVDEWLKRISEKIKSNNDNSLDLVNDFKLDLYHDEIYLFTPKGELKLLQKGATVLDFAYEIHSGIGNKCIGAKIKHKLVPLNHVLENGSQVQILTSEKQKPSEDWLNMVSSSKAKQAIKNALKSELRDNANFGKEILNRKLKNIDALYNDLNIKVLLQHYGEKNILIFLNKIKEGKINLGDLKKFKVVGGLIKIEIIENKKPIISNTENEIIYKVKEILKENSELLIMDESASKLNFSYAPCCNPLPGDDVFGFITIQDGIKIHRTNCPNSVNLMSKYAYRVVKTKWSNSKEISFLSGFKINGIDDLGLVNKMTNIISENHNVNIKSILIESNDGIFEGVIKLFVTDYEQLEELIKNIKRLDGVITINRL